MEALEDDLQHRLETALAEAAAGSLDELVDISLGQAGGDAIQLGAPDAGACLVGRPVEEPTPPWWDCDDASQTVAVLGGIFASTFFRLCWRDAREDVAAAGEIPMPELSRRRAAQLAVLYTALTRADPHAHEALRGSLDRCVADLYSLSLQLLTEIEQHIESQSPPSSI
jgi:hypothetical protein